MLKLLPSAEGVADDLQFVVISLILLICNSTCMKFKWNFQLSWGGGGGVGSHRS